MEKKSNRKIFKHNNTKNTTTTTTTNNNHDNNKTDVKRDAVMRQLFILTKMDRERCSANGKFIQQ